MKEENRISLTKDLRFILQIIGICSLIGLFEKIIPILDLFNHFRLHAIIGVLLLGLFAAFLKDKKAVFIALGILFFNLVIVGYHLQKTGGIDGLQSIDNAEYSIVAANVLTSNEDYKKLIDLITVQKPDVVILTEVDQKWLDNLKPLESTYKYSIKHPRPDNFGIAAYSITPMKADIKLLGALNLPVLVGNISGLTIIGAHPIPPSSVRNVNDNKRYLQEIASIMEHNEGPAVLAGDLNTTLWSSAIVPLIDVGFKRINPLGIAYTWPVGNFLFALQIDHFFGKNIKAADFQTLSSIGSDHYPIRADILVKKAAEE